MSPSNSLEQLRRLETGSSRFPAQIASILDGTEYRDSIETLQDEELMWLVEYLNNVLDTLDNTGPAFRTCLHELRRICGVRQTLPQSYTLPDFSLKIDCKPIVRGYYGDVHRGSLNGSEVRIKRLFTSSGGGGHNFTKNFYEEAVSWKRLEHPNIVPLLGITITSSPHQLVSGWISGGNLTEYIKNNSAVDQLGLIFGITNGLEYLHSNDVVHGNLKGPNILVDDSGRARISDFGLAMIPHQASKRAFLDDQTARWTAPEILHDSGTHGKKADVFALAMVMIEVFTGAVPFDTSLPGMAAIAIMQGNRPPRPTHPNCSDNLWAMMQRCWNQVPYLRPEVSEVLQVLPGSALSKLRRLYKPGMASHEFQLALGRFYGSTGYQDRVDGLNSADLKEFVDFLDTVLRMKGLNETLLRQTLHNLRRVCGQRATIPTSYVISGDLCDSNSAPPEVNQSPKIWTGNLNRLRGGTNQDGVHVRVVKLERPRKELYAEAATWVWLDHPNILKCFGITTDPIQVVTEWVPHVNVIEYIRSHLNADRICLLIDVVQGLDYLHSYGVTHRSLTSQIVLVNAAGRACLSDIGFTTFLSSEELEAINDESSTPYFPRWTAPEALKDGKFSVKADIFSFGFVAAEILGGELIWDRLTTAEVRSKIAEGERPSMPKGKVELGLTAEAWGMLVKCWKTEAEERISVPGMLSFLHYTPQPISGTSYSYEKATIRFKCQPDQDLIDDLDKILEGNEVSDNERARFLNILCKTCSRQRSVPKSMRIPCSYTEPAAEQHQGGYANVFKGEERGRSVAIKVVRRYLTNDHEVCLSKFCQEAVIWKHLRHPNILTLLGVSLETDKWAMISEWMDNGDINKFIKEYAEANRAQLLVDAAFGLDYMHSLQFVHGDLKGANILVSRDGRACLADFGLSTIIRTTRQATVDASVASTTSLVSFTDAGTPRWMSPELLYPDKFGIEDPRPTMQSDCYALGMVVYEVLLGKLPYWEIQKQSIVMDAIIRGVRPKKPYAAGSLGFTDGLWDVIERSWAVDIDARPDVTTILYHLAHAASIWKRRKSV